MADRPLILFPLPEKADRTSKPKNISKMVTPPLTRQYNRLRPVFSTLKRAFEQKAVTLQESSVGINPDFALVLEIIGTVDSFYTAVQHIEGMEWIFDKESTPLAPDEDFYEVDYKTKERTEDYLTGKVYCVLSNQQAMTQLLSLWTRYKNGEDDVFQRGFAGFRDVFTHIKTIRKWGAQDRIAETHAAEYWRESLELDGENPVPFEIELFYRSDASARSVAVQTITAEILAQNGRVLQECVIAEIAYHGMLVELPRAAVEDLVNRYEDIKLSQIDDIMFFRPTCQSVFSSDTDTESCTVENSQTNTVGGDPIIAVLDGMPLQNHPLLQGRIIIDDPDDYATGYESKSRVHGTEMVSLAIYGDLNRNENPINSPVYVRPILRPRPSGIDDVEECIPENTLFVDVLHRSVKRMMEGDYGEAPVAPNTRVINLSIGDPVRQLGTTMSPVARLIDYLAYKYKILFIISAGNHSEITEYVSSPFSELKNANISDRARLFGKAILDNQRNMRVLAPAESLNALTVGAIYDDFTNPCENDRFIWAVPKGFPSPASAVGKGYRSILTPDLFYCGGRKFIKGKFDGTVDWVLSKREPGCKVAAPYGTGDEAGQAYSFGTSDAAAQVTHEAAKCYDVLKEVFLNETAGEVPADVTAILLKAMITHGASWESVAPLLASVTDDSPKKLGKWIGNGIPNIERVMECTKERITLIGLGSLKKDEGDIYTLPLPVDFSSRLLSRKLTVTLAYLSPIAPTRQAYRTAQLWFDIDEAGHKLVPDRQNTEWQVVRKGTLQHEIFTGEKAIVWNDDDLRIKVNCTQEAGKLTNAVPYCLFVTFEVAEGFDVDLYTDVSTRIHQRVPIANT